jgi:hypothetical protein
VTGDQIVGCIAVVGMLSLVVPRLVNSDTPRNKLLQMVGLWVLIVAVIAAVVMALG